MGNVFLKLPLHPSTRVFETCSSSLFYAPDNILYFYFSCWDIIGIRRLLRTETYHGGVHIAKSNLIFHCRLKTIKFIASICNVKVLADLEIRPPEFQHLICNLVSSVHLQVWSLQPEWNHIAITWKEVCKTLGYYKSWKCINFSSTAWVRRMRFSVLCFPGAELHISGPPSPIFF